MTDSNRNQNPNGDLPLGVLKPTYHTENSLSEITSENYVEQSEEDLLPKPQEKKKRTTYGIIAALLVAGLTGLAGFQAFFFRNLDLFGITYEEPKAPITNTLAPEVEKLELIGNINVSADPVFNLIDSDMNNMISGQFDSKDSVLQAFARAQVRANSVADSYSTMGDNLENLLKEYGEADEETSVHLNKLKKVYEELGALIPASYVSMASGLAFLAENFASVESQDMEGNRLYSVENLNVKWGEITSEAESHLSKLSTLKADFKASISELAKKATFVQRTDLLTEEDLKLDTPKDPSKPEE